MKLLQILRLELSLQLRALTTWLYFLVLLVTAFLLITANFADDAREGYVLVNAPVIIGAVTVLGCVLWLLIGTSVAGHAAARDGQSRMHPLTYTAPVSKAEYLGGKFLAAFLINAMIMLALPAGILIAIYLKDVEAEIVGPFRLSTYIASYFFLALPNAFFATAIQFSIAVLKRSAMAGLLAGGLLFFLAYILGSLLNQSTVSSGWGNLVDPMSFSGMLNRYTSQYTPIQLNAAVISLDGPLLWNRLVWFVISLLTLAYTYFQFQFAHATVAAAWWKRKNNKSSGDAGIVETKPISVPIINQSFGLATELRQTLTIAMVSFRQLAKSYMGIFFLVILAVFVVLVVPFHMNFLHVPMLPRTSHLMTFLTAALTDAQTPWIIIPLLIILYAGELIWREREAGISDIAGAAPVKEWVLFTGKYSGLVLMLLLWLTLLMAAGIITQLRLNYHHIEIGQYLQTLFGMQLIDYLLFALLALTVHIVVNQKYIAHLLLLLTYGCITFANWLGIENKLFIFGSDTGWSYSDMNGFGPALKPWFWFKFYWSAWALLLAVLARLLWVSSKETGMVSRFRLATSRFAGFTRWTTVLSLVLIIATGAFIWYNGHVLNEYNSAAKKAAERIEYEKRFLHFEQLPQPAITGTKLSVNLFPEQNKANISGSYCLTNNTASPIDSILLSSVSGVPTQLIIFNRQVRSTANNNGIDQVFIFAEALKPGDSVHINFRVDYALKGFTNDGIKSLVKINGSYFTNRDLLPVIGFQPYRCLDDISLRRKHALAPRTALASLYNVEARNNAYGTDQTAFEATVSTQADQVGIAPGKLQRSWMANGRRYYHYVTNASIPNQYAIFSAKYAVKEIKWNGVNIQVFHHPGHTTNLNSMLNGARAALNYYSKEFGPYPYNTFRFIEHPGYGSGMHAEATTIDYEEGFSLLDPADSNAYDLPFYVVAHEAAHQWWGAQLLPARVEGAIALTETFAVFTGMQVLDEKYGDKYLQRYLTEIRKSYEIPRTKAAAPLLRATDKYQGYRKAPFALYALSKYTSREKVNGALKQLLIKHGSGKTPLPTTLDLYQELKIITPDTLQYLLHDLFAANTFWDLKTEKVTAQKTSTGSWQVTLELQARKETVDEMGNEKEISMNDWIEIGVFAESGDPLYLKKHRIHTGKQTIRVIVPEKPARAGIDPNFLLVDLKMQDNSKDIKK
jgi:ABC-2 type transport system permease protein